MDRWRSPTGREIRANNLNEADYRALAQLSPIAAHIVPPPPVLRAWLRSP